MWIDEKKNEYKLKLVLQFDILYVPVYLFQMLFLLVNFMFQLHHILSSAAAEKNN